MLDSHIFLVEVWQNLFKQVIQINNIYIGTFILNTFHFIKIQTVFQILFFYAKEYHIQNTSG